MDRKAYYMGKINNVILHMLNANNLLTCTLEDADNEIEEAMHELERIVNEWYSGSDFV